VPNPSELGRNRLLNGLADGDFTRLRANLKNVRLTVGTVLPPVGVPIKHVYFPESGMVSMLTVMSVHHVTHFPGVSLNDEERYRKPAKDCQLS
jgi:hypothetical protein